MRTFTYTLVLKCLLSTFLNGQNTLYSAADSLAALYPNHSVENLHELSIKLTKPLTSDSAKFRAIFKWVCDNVSNDYYMFIKNQRKRDVYKDKPSALSEWNQSLSQQYFRKSLIQKKTVCTGYAYFIRELASYAGIEAPIVDGYGRTAGANVKELGLPNHSWNAVLLNGKWHLCDVTWASGYIDGNNKVFVKSFNQDYFLTDPEVFKLNHLPLDNRWLLTSTGYAEEDFINSPLVYSGAISIGYQPLAPKTFIQTIKKGESVSFEFYLNDSVVTDALEIKMIRGSYYVETTGFNVPENVQSPYRYSFVFKNRGIHTVHITYLGKPVATYEVNVVK